MRNFKFFFGIMLIFIILSGCDNTKDPASNDCTDVYWTYNGNDNGQNKWVDLCNGFSACGAQAQSPVNISGSVADTNLPSLVFNYLSTPAEIENNGHTIEFACEEGSKLIIGAKEYKLLQFHYHSQSEHQVNGQSYPLEVHFVHKASETDYAVVGVFFEEGNDNKLFTKFLSHFPTQKGKYIDTTEIVLTELLPANKSFYHYSGSLTTPPCSETVSWYVLKNKVSASPAQLSQFGVILNNNYRNIQNLNGRKILSRDE